MDEKRGGSDKREFLVTFADFKGICRSSKKLVALCAAAGALLATFYSLSKTPMYEARATYKEKGRTKSGAEGGVSFAGMLGGSSVNQSEACTLMASRLLTEELVARHSLHAIVGPKRPPNNRWKNIRNNLKVEYAYNRQLPKPNIEDSAKPFLVANAEYPGELPLGYEIASASEKEYDLYDNNGTHLGRYPFGAKVETDQASFTLLYDTTYPLPQERYVLALLPLSQMAAGIADKIIVQPDPKDKTLLNLTFNHPDRHITAQVLNSLMSIYHDYLESEQERISLEQISYLEKRQREANKQLSQALESYAAAQVHDMNSDGFLNVESAMQFLTANQQAHKKKLLALELEAGRLKSVKKTGYAYYDRYVTEGDPSIINSLLQEMRALKQKGDAIKIALEGDKRFSPSAANDAFAEQISQLDIVQAAIAELRLMETALERGKLLSPSEKLMKSPNSTLGSWHAKLHESKQAIEAAVGPYSRLQKEEEWRGRKEQFHSYLSNLLHSYEVQEKTLKEKLSHQTSGGGDFAGLDLSLAHDLFLSYHRQLNEIEGQLVQNQFVVDNLQDEDFEVSALSNFHHDPITNDIIGRYSQTLLALRDESNRSSKEQERIRNDLLRHRGFLEMHLTQALQLLELRGSLLRDKLFALQSVTLGLIQQQVSILEQQLSDYIATRIQDIEKESGVINQQLQTLNKEIARLPSRWIAEQYVTQQMEMGQRVGREITQLVESKNINNNLEVIQSAPVDIAIAPLYPKRSYPLFYALVGAFGASFLALGSQLMISTSRGLRATAENLSEIGEHVAGSLTPQYGGSAPLHDEDLATLRRLMAELAPQKGEREPTLLVIGERGADYSRDLALLAVKKGLKVLLLPTFFDRGKPQEGGLLQYLEGEISYPKIAFEREGYSTIAAGGCSRYGCELVTSERFRKLLEQLCGSYDWVIAVAAASASSTEVQAQLPLFPRVAVTLFDETVQELRPYFSLEKTRIAYLFGRKV